MTTARRRLAPLGIPLATLLLAFVIGGLAVAIVGANPVTVYEQMLDGAGIRWLLQWLPGNPFGVTIQQATIGEANLVSTLLGATPLILTGLAVGFAFRCGVFNIGAGGQLVAGAFAAWAVAYLVPNGLGVVLGLVAGTLAGFLYAALPGGLRAYRGAHEVISTIMLNWVAIQLAHYLVGIGGPLQDAASYDPYSKPLADAARLPTFWGQIERVHVGLFVAIAAAVAYWLILERTTLGYEVKAVGHNPEGARYGGVAVERAIVLAMAVAGAFAGLAGAGEVLGRSGIIQESVATGTWVNLGFTGIAVALLGRNHAVGIVLGALLFAALDAGARNLGGSDFSPELARTLATIIQGVIILLVGGEAIVRWIFKRRRRKATVTLPPTAPSPSVEGGAAL